MSHHQDRGHGTWQLEELLRAFQAVYTTLPTEREDGMSAREVDGLYFLLQELTLRLEDVFYVLVQEQIGQGAGGDSTSHQHSPQTAG